MRLLDALVRQDTQRLSMGEWLSQTATYSVGGNAYTLPFKTTLPGQKAERLESSFEGYVLGGLQSNGVIFNLASVRGRVFSEARLMWQGYHKGRPGDLFSTPELETFEQPWPGGTFGDLLSMVLLHADFGGNGYVVAAGDGYALLRPDWVDILLGDRRLPTGEVIGRSLAGYHFWPDGDREATPTILGPTEVAHFAPQRDPLASFRGMSWLTPVIRDLMADGAATAHKLAFFENAATPNLAVSLPKEITPQQFDEFVETMDAKHKGVKDAYKTLYTGGGADVTVIGANMQQLDFKVTQGAGETRLAAAAGVPPTVANISEGMQGSSLNAGNFGQARRQFADTTMSHLWRNMAGSLQVLTQPPAGSRLWYDSRDIPFLREDQKDAAEIEQLKAATSRQYIDAGFTPESAVAAVAAQDITLLVHSGLVSVQLQPPGATPAEAPPVGRGEIVVERAVPMTMNVYPVIESPVHIDNHLPPAEAPVNVVNVAPTPVTVEAARMEAPIVNVAAPTVNVEAPNVTVPVTVQPAEVVMVDPPRTRRVVRDSNGNITKVVEE